MLKGHGSVTNVLLRSASHAVPNAPLDGEWRWLPGVDAMAVLLVAIDLVDYPTVIMGLA
jgi:hypothetical protein